MRLKRRPRRGKHRKGRGAAATNPGQATTERPATDQLATEQMDERQQLRRRQMELREPGPRQPDRPQRAPSHPPPAPIAEPPGPLGPVAFPRVPDQRRAVVSGLIASLAGAAAFTVFCMVTFAASGRGVLTPINLVAFTFWSGAPRDGTFQIAALLMGLVIIAAVGVVIGLPLALLLHNMGPHWAIVLALTLGLLNVIWVIGEGLAWPAINNEAVNLFLPLWSWLGHIVYALVFGGVWVAIRPRPSGVPGGS